MIPFTIPHSPVRFGNSHILGLLATFVAILMVLAGDTYNPNDPVQAVAGIDQLINGLSGKFLPSIMALVLSVVFTLLGKKSATGS